MVKYLSIILAAIFGFFALLCISEYIQICLGIITPIEIPIVLEGTTEYLETKYQLIGQNFGTLAIILACIFLSTYFYSKYHRQNRKRKDTFDKDSIKGPFVLYLRSFIDDKTTRKRISFINDVRSEEEVLVEVMSDIAPVYAIGDPKDKRMPLGASRIYVDDEHWKSTVIDMMNKAVVVVLRLGKTDSFWWEVETAVKSIDLEKVMFIIPESKTFNNVAMLYKILLDNNIDIKNLNINIEKKYQGSISSFLFFDKNGNAISKEVKTPRLTRMVLSYENILCNALWEYREKFGLISKRKHTIRIARLLEICLMFYILFIGVAKMFSDYASLKYQMPYELVEECVRNSSFSNKYSDEINGTNLTWGIVESKKGLFALEEDKYKLMFLIEANAIQLMKRDELLHTNDSPENMLLMVKKYLPDSYMTYVRLLSEAAIIAIENPSDIIDVINLYKSNIDYLPQWVIDLIMELNDVSGNEYELCIYYYNIIIEHLNDEDIVEILKTISSQDIAS